MADRCTSTALCVRRDQKIFEKLGYRLDAAQALNTDGDGIPGAVVMIDEQAAGGHYDELTALKDIPFVVSNAACPGAYGDHLIGSTGSEWIYAEALSESNYPAVRVKPDGGIVGEALATAGQYWQVYAKALKAFEERAPDPSNESRSEP